MADCGCWHTRRWRCNAGLSVAAGVGVDSQSMHIVCKYRHFQSTSAVPLEREVHFLGRASALGSVQV